MRRLVTINTTDAVALMSTLTYHVSIREVENMDAAKDDLASELGNIFNKKAKQASGWYRLTANGKFVEVPILDEESLFEQLVIYITSRDQKVWDHAFKLGKESHGRQS